MRFYKWYISVFIYPSLISAQSKVEIEGSVYIVDNHNYIRNGDMELFEPYPYTESELKFAKHWFHGCQSPDYFYASSTLPSLAVPSNHFGFQWPRSGQAYAGFLRKQAVNQGSMMNFTEVLSHFLENPLLKGKYLLEFYFSVAALPNCGCNVVSLDRLGVSMNSVISTLHTNDIHLFNPLNEIQTLQDTANWSKAQMILEANGGELVLSIGSFSQNAEVEYVTIEDYSNLDSWSTYYYIDDVSMYRIIDSIPVADSVTVTNVTLFPNPSPNGQFTLEYNVHEDAQPVFSMYDATGRLVGSQTLPGGQQRVPLDYSRLAGGVYLWRLEQNGAFVGGGKATVMR